MSNSINITKSRLINRIAKWFRYQLGSHVITASLGLCIIIFAVIWKLITN